MFTESMHGAGRSAFQAARACEFSPLKSSDRLRNVSAGASLWAKEEKGKLGHEPDRERKHDLWCSVGRGAVMPSFRGCWGAFLIPAACSVELQWLGWGLGAVC